MGKAAKNILIGSAIGLGVVGTITMFAFLATCCGFAGARKYYSFKEKEQDELADQYEGTSEDED